jgi:membrane protease YdiL (CAAX protease family)
MLQKGAFSNKSFGVKCGIFALLNLLGLSLWLSLSWTANLTEDSVGSLIISQFLFSIFGLVIPALSIAFLLKKEGESYLQINRLPKKKLIALAIIAIFLMQPFVNLTALWNDQISFPETLSALESKLRLMEKMANDFAMQFLEGTSINNLLSNLLILALVPAVTEELFFRGALQKLLSDKLGHHFAIWFVAIIFSAYHLQFFGFFPRIFLGAFLGYLLLWSKSLYLPMIAHFINNASLVVFYFLNARKIINIDVDSIGIGDQWWISILSLICLIPIINFMNKRYIHSKKVATS